MAPKVKPSQPTSTIEDLFSSLNEHVEQSDYSQVVRLADQILAIAPGDEDAVRCKVVALIKVDNFDQALLTIQSLHRVPTDLSFFKAYCLYKQNKLDEALQSLMAQERSSTSMVLESQILFRLGKMDGCVEVYQKLLMSKIDSLENNIVASLVLAGRASEVPGLMETLRVKATSSFDLAFNTACSFIETKNYTEAEQLLLSARRIGRETLMEDNEADDEIEKVLAPVAVQLAYVQQLLGCTEEAFESYSNIINRNMADESSLAVAINNLITLRCLKEIFDSIRKMDRLFDKSNGARTFQLSEELDSKLQSRQKEVIYANRLLLMLHANRIGQARELAVVLLEKFPDSVMPVLLHAAVLARENKPSRAEEILSEFAKKFPDKSRPVLLARAQVAATACHPQIACDSLTNISDIRHMPATIATLVSLKEHAGDTDGAHAVFDSSLEFWSNAMTEDNKLSVVMREAAAFKARHGQEVAAARLYEELVRGGESTETLAGLVAATARVNVEKAEAYAKRLRPLRGVGGIDVDSLERSGGAKPVEGSFSYGGKEKGKGKKKRKRKPRYPKGFDPANPGPGPDPERWLPKRERSSYRPKRRDRRAGAAQVRGSQGAVGRERHEGGAGSEAGRSNQANQAKGGSQNSAPGPSKPSSKSSKKKSRR